MNLVLDYRVVGTILLVSSSLLTLYLTRKTLVPYCIQNIKDNYKILIAHQIIFAIIAGIIMMLTNSPIIGNVDSSCHLLTFHLIATPALTLIVALIPSDLGF